MYACDAARIQCPRIRTSRFSDLKKRNVTLYVFFEIITSKSRKKSLAKVLSSIFRNEFTYTSLSDRYNSVPSSPSVIHSEPLPNTLFICPVSSRSGCSGCSGSEQIRSHDFLRYINLYVYVCMYMYGANYKRDHRCPLKLYVRFLTF